MIVLLVPRLYVLVHLHYLCTLFMAVNVAFSCTWYMSIPWVCLNFIELSVPDMYLYMTHTTQSMM